MKHNFRFKQKAQKRKRIAPRLIIAGTVTGVFVLVFSLSLVQHTITPHLAYAASSDSFNTINPINTPTNSITYESVKTAQVDYKLKQPGSLNKELK